MTECHWEAFCDFDTAQWLLPFSLFYGLFYFISLHADVFSHFPVSVYFSATTDGRCSGLLMYHHHLCLLRYANTISPYWPEKVAYLSQSTVVIARSTIFVACCWWREDRVFVTDEDGSKIYSTTMSLNIEAVFCKSCLQNYNTSVIVRHRSSRERQFLLRKFHYMLLSKWCLDHRLLVLWLVCNVCCANWEAFLFNVYCLESFLAIFRTFFRNFRIVQMFDVFLQCFWFFCASETIAAGQMIHATSLRMKRIYVQKMFSMSLEIKEMPKMILAWRPQIFLSHSLTHECLQRLEAAFFLHAEVH